MGCMRLAGVFVSSVFLLGGCAANDMVIKRQTETETKVEHLFQMTGSNEARYNDLATRLASIEEKDPGRQAAMKELQDKVKELLETNRKLNARLEVMSIAAVPRVELVNPEPLRGKEAGPPPGYVKAFGLYSTNQFQAAIVAFEQFLKENPSGEYTPNAWYWIGECHYSKNELQQGLAAFQKVVDGWPKHPKAADSLLKIGYSYSALRQPDKAKAAFERIIRSYPASPATVKARERLMSIDNPAN